ncbi:UDP-3-O-(3-hydroxymyristoyl)glucosamine N-acyltransferase, partial [Halomonas sp. SIMBA_159]
MPPTAVGADGVKRGEGVSVQGNAVIDAGVVLAERVGVGAGSVIGAECLIADATRLQANVTV